MRTVAESTAHYRAVIADLSEELQRLTRAHQEAQRVAEQAAKALADFQQTVAVLEARALAIQEHELPMVPAVQSEAQWNPNTPIIQPGLPTGEACVVALRFLGKPSSNKEIAEILKQNGYGLDSVDMANNVGVCLNHRRKTKKDVLRVGRNWVLHALPDLSAVANSTFVQNLTTLAASIRSQDAS